MQDPRLRLLSVAALSLAAFLAVQGAVLAFAWWLLTRQGPVRIVRSKWPLVAFLPLALVTIVLFLTGTGWFSYSARLAVVFLIAVYAYQDQGPGEFLGVCTWLFGKKTGFEIGLAGELGLRSLRFLEEETERARQAFLLKGIPWGVKSIIPVSVNLLFGVLHRASDQADLLVARGFSRGGSSCVRFSPAGGDILLTIAAVAAAIAAFVPLGEFFILIQ